MSELASIVVSDAHLGAAPEDSENAFHEFLGFAGRATTDLVINGDLFDFWFEYRTVVLRKHFRTLGLLKDLVEADVRIRLVGGNHDSWGGSFLAEDIGLELVEGPIVTEIGGRRTLLAHGDGLGRGDWGYRALKRVLRSRPARFAFAQLHPDWGGWLADRVSRTEARRESQAHHEIRRTQLEAYARSKLAADPSLQLVALGHCHHPELIEVNPGQHYLNTGDWIDSCTWASVDPAEVRLHRWETG